MEMLFSALVRLDREAQHGRRLTSSRMGTACRRTVCQCAMKALANKSTGKNTASNSVGSMFCNHEIHRLDGCTVCMQDVHQICTIP